MAAFRGMYCLKSRPVRGFFQAYRSEERMAVQCPVEDELLKVCQGGNLSSAWLLAKCKNRRIAVNLLRAMVDEYRGLRRTSDVDQCMLYRGLLLMLMDRSNATNAIISGTFFGVQAL